MTAPVDIAELRRKRSAAGNVRLDTVEVYGEPGNAWLYEPVGVVGDPDVPDTRIAEMPAVLAAFCAAAVNALPALLDEVERLRLLVDGLDVEIQGAMADYDGARSQLAALTAERDALRDATGPAWSDGYAQGMRDAEAVVVAAEARATSVTAERDALRDDRKRALKRADALTLDTQTCEEATTALVSMVRVARADAECARARATSAEGEAARYREAMKWYRGVAEALPAAPAETLTTPTVEQVHVPGRLIQAVPLVDPAEPPARFTLDEARAIAATDANEELPATKAAWDAMVREADALLAAESARKGGR